MKEDSAIYAFVIIVFKMASRMEGAITFKMYSTCLSHFRYGSMCRPRSFAFCVELITVSPIFTFIVLPLIFLSVPTIITVDLFGFITNLLAVIHFTVISMFFGDEAQGHSKFDCCYQ